MSQDNEAASTTVQPKYTRYRSVRRAAAEESAAKEQVVAATTTHEQNVAGNGPIQRSMSRYRRPRAASKADQTTSPPPTAVPAVPALPLATQFNQNVPVGVARRVTEPASRNHTQTTQIAARNTSQRQRTAGRDIDDPRVFAPTVEEKLAEQKRKDLERLEATLDAATQGPPGSSVNSPVREKFGFFSRKRPHAKTAPPTVPTTVSATVPAAAAAPVLPTSSSTSIARSGGSNDTPRVSNERPIPRAAGGAVVVPGTDAPISAVNSGERRVLVRHKQSSINLPITPNTTALDIFYSSANIMTHNIASANSVLLESYTQLGLERRVRRYERVRDIMNSWDRDTQNALILQNSDSPKFDTDLESSSVPKDPPPDVTVYLYHSQKPGRWHKCYVTLLASGQMFMAKKEGAKLTDKDVVNLCHLSDFDIYTPVPAQLRKLKAPKKFCYAVKSQQKTTMFLSTENFVHFFSSDDELLANKWYGAVQRWRSWYLVHRMGEGGEVDRRVQTGKKPSKPNTAVPGARAAPGQNTGDDRPYLIGSFQPLFNGGTDPGPEADSYDSEDDPRDSPPSQVSQVPFHLRNSTRLSSAPNPRDKRHPPPVSYRLPPEAGGGSGGGGGGGAGGGEEFASSSLLGRTYSERLKAQRERETTQQQQDLSNGPFVDGPSLLNNISSGGHRRSLSVRSSRTTSRDQQQQSSSSQAQAQNKPKPLLDFTPKYKDAPQWDRSGKGRGVTAPEGVKLVQVATGPEGMMDMPKNNVFQREVPTGMVRPATSGAKRGGGGGSIMNRGRVGYD